MFYVVVIPFCLLSYMILNVKSLECSELKLFDTAYAGAHDFQISEHFEVWVWFSSIE